MHSGELGPADLCPLSGRFRNVRYVPCEGPERTLAPITIYDGAGVRICWIGGEAQPQGHQISEVVQTPSFGLSAEKSVG